jgi:hypothetical protein
MKQIYLLCFSVIWILAIFSDYWNKHLLHKLGIENYSHWTYAVVLLLLTAGTGYILTHAKNSGFFNLMKSRVMMLPYFILMLVILYCVNAKYTGLTIDITSIGTVFWKGFYSSVLLILIWLAPYSLGNLVRRKIGVRYAGGESFTIDLVIGLACYSLILFVLSFIKVLYLPTILILLIACLAINYKHIWQFTKTKILSPPAANLSWISWILISIILVIFSLNYFSDMVPFPNGFDSRNYYMNVTKLIATSHGMVSGFQAYPWQLFMAQGHTLTGGGGMLPQLISMSSILFILIGAFELCTKYLNISKQNTYLALALFIITPAVQNHLFIEIKVDLGLVLTQVALLILVMDHLHKYKTSQVLPSIMDIVLLGFITGYGVSIKTLNFYLIFALIVALWSLIFRFKGFVATFFLSIGAILLAQFDSVTGMNQYHQSIELVKYGTIIIGLAGLVWIAISQMESLIKATKTSIIYIGVMLLTFSPWLVKNMVDTKSMNPSTLIKGEDPGPDINMQLIRKNYPPK